MGDEPVLRSAGETLAALTEASPSYAIGALTSIVRMCHERATLSDYGLAEAERHLDTLRAAVRRADACAAVVEAAREHVQFHSLRGPGLGPCDCRICVALEDLNE